MAGWDVTVLSAALSLVGGIVWAIAKLALSGGKPAAVLADRLAEKTSEVRPDFGAVSLQGND